MAVRTVADRTFWSTTLPARSASVPRARHFAHDAIHELGCDAAEESATLLVSELVTNAVLHAGTPVRLSLWRHDGNLRVEVRDDDPTPPRLRTPQPLRPGGRGMLLVDLLSSSWGINHNDLGKTVWFEVGS